MSTKLVADLVCTECSNRGTLWFVESGPRDEHQTVTRVDGSFLVISLNGELESWCSRCFAPAEQKGFRLAWAEEERRRAKLGGRT
jgi:hypothetical protein